MKAREFLTAHGAVRAPDVAAECFAGAIAASIALAYAVSFAALLFQGDLSGGFATGLWSLLITVVVAGTYVNLFTSVPPMGAGPDTPMIAVATLLAGSVASSILAVGGSAEQAVTNTLFSLTLMTVLSGLAVYLLGALKIAHTLRFIPYPVVAGFLAATGWLMMAASYKVVTGQSLTAATTAGFVDARWLPQLAVAAGLAGTLLALRHYISAQYLMPVVFFGAAAVLDIFLWSYAVDQTKWFVTGVENLRPWLPLAAAVSGDIDWLVMLRAVPEMIACMIVGIISLLVKISSLESSRQLSADFNQEFRATGGASLIAAPLGGLPGSVLLGPTKALTEAGSRTRVGGVAAALCIGGIVVAGLDLPAYVPKPILAGFLLLLGYTISVDALKAAFSQKSWLEFALALAIAITCLQFGYIAGVAVGFVCACLIFAVSYGRIGVIRRQVTRADFSSGAERTPHVEQLLRQHGDAIRIYWLSGYLFFGSSESLVDQVRSSIDEGSDVRYLILDFSSVSGIDSSALASLAKLRSLAAKGGTAIIYCALPSRLRDALARACLLDKGGPDFANLTDAITAVEEQFLTQLATQGGGSLEEFGGWLSAELDCAIPVEVITAHFERNEYADGDIIYRQGGPADTIDFILTGAVCLTRQDEQGSQRLIRRSMRQTVLGEMGFFRNRPRAVTISADGTTVVYAVSRQGLERLRMEWPDVYEALLRYVIRTLSDRLEFAHKEIAALM